jgi:chemotaxis protein methyltransferase CheR
MVELGLASAAAYQEWIVAHPEELQVLDGLCRIPISRFYRDRGVFDHLRDPVLPELAETAQTHGRREVRCWSAGCASGEEPYTLNIIWRQSVLPRISGVVLTIIATDSSPEMLERARRGLYRSSSLKDLPSDWAADCFAVVNGEYSLRMEYRDGIEWDLQDIRRGMPHGEFDLILCRHLVFTYFDEVLQAELFRKMLSQLRPGGYLVTGKQEPLLVESSELKETNPRMGVYQKVDNPNR